ncbi:chymotrypsin A-like [Oppia nitens]|uniref:chymotrypsin A-like n=1 Tax=Oppia nitens TaxID=1686743 RepID=UPI0023DBEFAC|nr:chymotrypsin A-like [Oppia nitens]
MTGGQCFRWSSNAIAIQNGRLATPGEWPWIALVLLNKYSENKTIVKRCTGSILNTNWILTAAHCILPNFTLTVRTVQDMRDTMGYTYSVDQSFVHTGYPNKTIGGKPDKRYDIALVKLVEQIPILDNNNTDNTTTDTNTNTTTSDGHHRYQQPMSVNSICLPDKDIVNTENELALMAGFGYIDDGVDNYGPLMMGGQMIAEPFFNENDSNGTFIIGYRHPLNLASAAVCRGDSGSPLIQYAGGRAVLIGTHRASNRDYGNGTVRECTIQNIYARMYYIRVSLVIDWIIDTVINN